MLVAFGNVNNMTVKNMSEEVDHLTQQILYMQDKFGVVNTQMKHDLHKWLDEAQVSISNYLTAKHDQEIHRIKQVRDEELNALR